MNVPPCERACPGGSTRRIEVRIEWSGKEPEGSKRRAGGRAPSDPPTPRESLGRFLFLGSRARAASRLTAALSALFALSARAALALAARFVARASRRAGPAGASAARRRAPRPTGRRIVVLPSALVATLHFLSIRHDGSSVNGAAPCRARPKCKKHSARASRRKKRAANSRSRPGVERLPGDEPSVQTRCQRHADTRLERVRGIAASQHCLTAFAAHEATSRTPGSRKMTRATRGGRGDRDEKRSRRPRERSRSSA